MFAFSDKFLKKLKFIKYVRLKILTPWKFLTLDHVIEIWYLNFIPLYFYSYFISLSSLTATASKELSSTLKQKPSLNSGEIQMWPTHKQLSPCPPWNKKLYSRFKKFIISLSFSPRLTRMKNEMKLHFSKIKKFCKFLSSKHLTICMRRFFSLNVHLLNLKIMWKIIIFSADGNFIAK